MDENVKALSVQEKYRIITETLIRKNISAAIESVSALKDGKIVKHRKDECGFSYRKSPPSRKG